MINSCYRDFPECLLTPPLGMSPAPHNLPSPQLSHKCGNTQHTGNPCHSDWLMFHRLVTIFITSPAPLLCRRLRPQGPCPWAARPPSSPRGPQLSNDPRHRVSEGPASSAPTPPAAPHLSLACSHVCTFSLSLRRPSTAGPRPPTPGTPVAAAPDPAGPTAPFGPWTPSWQPPAPAPSESHISAPAACVPGHTAAPGSRPPIPASGGRPRGTSSSPPTRLPLSPAPGRPPTGYSSDIGLWSGSAKGLRGSTRWSAAPGPTPEAPRPCRPHTPGQPGGSHAPHWATHHAAAATQWLWPRWTSHQATTGPETQPGCATTCHCRCRGTPTPPAQVRGPHSSPRLAAHRMRSCTWRAAPAPRLLRPRSCIHGS